MQCRRRSRPGAGLLREHLRRGGTPRLASLEVPQAMVGMMLCRHEEEWRCYYDRLATAGDGKRTGVRSRGEGFSWQASPQQRRRLTLPGQAQACGRLAGMPPKSRHYQEQRDFFRADGGLVVQQQPLPEEDSSSQATGGAGEGPGGSKGYSVAAAHRRWAVGTEHQSTNPRSSISPKTGKPCEPKALNPKALNSDLNRQPRTHNSTSTP